MDFIKSNKGLIIGILVGVFVIGVVFVISTKTGLFDEDERLFNNIDENVDETGEVIVGDTPEEDSDTTGLSDVPEEIESFVELPSGQSVYDGTNEDGTYSTLEAEVTRMWEQTGMMPDDSDESIVRDAKEQARITSFEDYMELKEQGLESITAERGVDLGTPGYLPKSDFIFKNNEVVDLGEVKIVGANIDGYVFGVNFEIQNESGEILDMDEVQNKLQFRFVEDIGLGTDWFGVGENAKTYTGIAEYNSEGWKMDKYLGRGLTKGVEIISMDEGNGLTLMQALDSGGIVDTLDEMESLGYVLLGDSESEVDEKIKKYQSQLPDELKLEVKYGEETSDYTILKTEEDMGYNYEEGLK